MQQDRLIGAAGEGRYGAVRGWAGRPEYGNSLLVKEPLAATDVERLDLGIGRSAHRARRRAAGRRDRARRRDASPPRRRRRGRARRPGSGARSTGSSGAPAADAIVAMGDFNADPAEPTYARMGAAGFRSAYVEANGAEPAVTWPSGLQAPAMDTDGDPDCLDYIWVRGTVAGRRCAARVRPAGPGRPDALPERPPRHQRPPRDRVSVAAMHRAAPRTLRLAHRGDWRHAPENSLAALLARWPVPGCDGLEFDVRRSSDGVPVLLHDETLERVQGRPDRVDALTAEALEALGIPTLADVLAAIGRRAFLDVELKGEHDRAVVEVLASGRGADLRDAVVSSFETATLERVGGLAPSWPRWLNSETLDADGHRDALELGCRGCRRRWRGHRRRPDGAGPRRRARGRGLDGPPPGDVRPAGPPGRRGGVRGGRRPRRLDRRHAGARRRPGRARRSPAYPRPTPHRRSRP